MVPGKEGERTIFAQSPFKAYPYQLLLCYHNSVFKGDGK